MGSRRRSAFTRSSCLVSSFSCARSFFRSASHWSRETIGGCGIVLAVICDPSLSAMRHFCPECGAARGYNLLLEGARGADGRLDHALEIREVQSHPVR